MELGKRAAAAGDDDFARIEEVGGSVCCHASAAWNAGGMPPCSRLLLLDIALRTLLLLLLDTALRTLLLLLLLLSLSRRAMPACAAGADRRDGGVCGLAVRNGHQQVWVRLLP